MQLVPKITYTLQIDGDELRLINKALRGSLQQDEITAAATLSSELCRQRVEQTKRILGEIDKLEKNLFRTQSSQ